MTNFYLLSLILRILDKLIVSETDKSTAKVVTILTTSYQAPAEKAFIHLNGHCPAISSLNTKSGNKGTKIYHLLKLIRA